MIKVCSSGQGIVFGLLKYMGGQLLGGFPGDHSKPDGAILLLRIECVCVCSVMSDFATYGLSMELFRQEYWSGLPFPITGDLPNRGIKPIVPALAYRLFTPEPPGKLRIEYISPDFMSLFLLLLRLDFQPTSLPTDRLCL